MIDELIDMGVLMHTGAKVILERIKTSSSRSNVSASAAPAEEAASSGLFSSVFSSARSQLAKSMWM